LQVTGRKLIRAVQRNDRNQVKQLLDIEDLRILWESSELDKHGSHVDRATSLRRVVEKSEEDQTSESLNQLLDLMTPEDLRAVLFNQEKLNGLLNISGDVDAQMLKEVYLEATKHKNQQAMLVLLAKLSVINEKVYYSQ
jgi:hypothetical protein